MKIKWLLICLALLPLACNLGPLLVEPTPTPTATETPAPTLAPASTVPPAAAPTAEATVFLIPTQIPPPTLITCPKGTELDKSTNTCFYVTRTPKPGYCPDYKGKAGCVSHGCSWNPKSGTCS